MPSYRLHVPTAAPRPASSGLSVRRSSLAATRIGLLWNGKPNGEHFLGALGEALRRSYPSLEVVTASKPSSSEPAPPSVLEQLRECYGVVTALGD